MEPLSSPFCFLYERCIIQNFDQSPCVCLALVIYLSCLNFVVVKIFNICSSQLVKLYKITDVFQV
jgi:hypothetical protein